MKFDRPDIVYRYGLLAERRRYRVRDVPLRYRQTWPVSRRLDWRVLRLICTTSITSETTTLATWSHTPSLKRLVPDLPSTKQFPFCIGMTHERK